MQLFGPLHLSILGAIAAIGVVLAWLCRAHRIPARTVRLLLGYGIGANEIVWWIYRYSREGIHLSNLPLQLCDATVWTSVLACITLRSALVEFTYFAGIAGAGMALLTPDLVFPWPSYPAIYFFIAHGGIVVAIAVLVFGRIAPLRTGAPWRAFGMLIGYAVLVGVFNAISGANYMYLCHKPGNTSLLDALGPWPLYLAASAVIALALFWLLWIPARQRSADLPMMPEGVDNPT